MRQPGQILGSADRALTHGYQSPIKATAALCFKHFRRLQSLGTTAARSGL